MAISKDSRSQLYELLVLQFETQEARQGLLQSAFHGSPLLNKFNYSGNADEFTQRLLTELLKFGNVDNQHAAIVLLEALNPQVGHNVQQKIAQLISQIQNELSHPPDSVLAGQGQKRKRTALYIALFLIVLVAGSILIINRFYLSNASDSNNMPQNNLLGAATSTPMSTGTLNLRIIYSDDKAFTIYANETSNIGYLEIRTTDNQVVLYQDFEVLAQTGGILAAGTCLRYTNRDEEVVLARACQEDTTFEKSLDPNDIFWHNFGTNVTLDTAIYWQGTLLKLCSVASGGCSIESE